jgi:hypothetical protein
MPIANQLYTEPYEAPSGTLYDDYIRYLGPLGVGTYNFAAWGAFLNMDGIYVTSPCNLNISEINSINRTKLFPNPTNSIITIQSESNITEVTIFSMEGKLVHSLNSNSTSLEIDISNLSPGCYNIIVTDTNGKSQSRIIKL